MCLPPPLAVLALALSSTKSARFFHVYTLPSHPRCLRVQEILMCPICDNVVLFPIVTPFSLCQSHRGNSTCQISGRFQGSSFRILLMGSMHLYRVTSSSDSFMLYERLQNAWYYCYTWLGMTGAWHISRAPAASVVAVVHSSESPWPILCVARFTPLLEWGKGR